jgi:probable rRNA maturation factor
VGQSLQVEVSVQDCFADDEQPGTETAGIAALTWEDWFGHWLDRLQPDISPIQAYELTLRLTSDAEIQALNAQYRQKNQPTDVLAFAALEVEAPEIAEMQDQPVYLGDIIISVETAKAQAAQQGHLLQQELAWLAAHGLLHLLGWDHPDDEQLMQMLQQQEVLLQTVGLRTEYC